MGNHIKLGTPVCLEPNILKTGKRLRLHFKDRQWETDDVTRPMTSHDPERSSCDSNTHRVKYHENCWRCYLAKVANYQIVCCEAVQSAVEAIAWLLIGKWSHKAASSLDVATIFNGSLIHVVHLTLDSCQYSCISACVGKMYRENTDTLLDDDDDDENELT